MSKKMKVRVLQDRCKFCKHVIKTGDSGWNLEQFASIDVNTPEAIKAEDISSALTYVCHKDGTASYAVSVVCLNNDFDVPYEPSEPLMFSVDIPIKYCPYCGRRLRAKKIPKDWND